MAERISAARALGDLKENAEYHSAKLKQSNAQKRARSLQLRITRARFVEDAEYREGVAIFDRAIASRATSRAMARWVSCSSTST